MAQQKIATEILKQEYAKAVISLAIKRADELATKQAAPARGARAAGETIGNAINWFRGASKPAVNAAQAAPASRPAAQITPPPVPAAAPKVAPAAQPEIRLPTAPLVHPRQRAALRNAATPAERNKILYNSPEAPKGTPAAPMPAAPTAKPPAVPPTTPPAATPGAGGGKGALIPTKPVTDAPLAGELVPGGRIPAPWRKPSATVDGKIDTPAGGTSANDLFNKYRSMTGMNGGLGALVGTSAAYGGAAALDENYGTNFTSGPQSLTPTGLAGSVMFPVQTAVGLANSGGHALVDAVTQPTATPDGAVKFDTAAGDALLPQSAPMTTTQPTAAANAPATTATPGNKFPYAAGGPGGVASTGAGVQNAQPKPQLTPEQQTAAATDLQAKLKTTTDPKARETLITDYASTLNLDAPTQTAAAAFARGEKTPEAQAFEKKYMQPALGNFVNDATGGAGASSPGEFGQITQMWEGLGTAGQMAFAIGVPLALLGVLGGSGAGMLLGALGIGAAGLAAASSGLFGETAQNTVAGATDAAAEAAGISTKAPEQVPFEYTTENANQFLNQLSGTDTGMYANLGAGSQNSLRSFATANKPALEAMLARPSEELAGLATNLAPEAQKNLAERLQLMRGRVPDNPKTPDVNESQQAQQKIDAVLAAIKTSMFNEKLAAILVMQKAARCWSGYEPVPGKKPYSEDSCRPIGSKKKKKKKTEKKAATPAWQRSAGKNPEGGLNEKGRKSYERETGGNLKAPVTESNPSGESAKRQNSFCSRMCGMKRVNTGSKTKADPDSRINKSLRKWNCKCSSAMEFGNKIAQLEKQAANPACPGGVCRRPPAEPQKAAPPQYSKTPFDRAYAEAAFKQHNIPFNAAHTDQQLYNLYTRKGSVKPGQKMNPFQAMVGERHGYLPPAPIQPPLPQAKPPTTQTSVPPRQLPTSTSTDIAPPALTAAPAPSPFKAAPRPQSPPTRTMANAALAKPAMPPKVR